MTKTFKPLLASPVEWDKVNFSTTRFVASKKLDGIRCIVINGVAMTRSLKPIPNKFIQARFGRPEYEGLDGELIVGPANASDVYRVTNSAVMSHDGEPDAHFFVFDHVGSPDLPYEARLHQADDQVSNVTFASLLPQIRVHDKVGVDALEEAWLAQGYEGVMLRDLDAAYKFGRATAKSCTLLKVKQMESAEAVILGFDELMRNLNTPIVNELNHTARSSHKDNLCPGGTLGALIVKDVTTGVIFNIGTGFDQHTRDTVWSNKDKYIGAIVSYTYFPVGVKDLPRFPSFKGFRSALDM